jgi:hypothetical protein
MLLLWALPIGILLGYLRGGRLETLSRLELRGLWLIFLALAVQLLIFPLGSGGAILPLGTSGTAVLHLGSYGFLGAFVWLNRREWGIVLMGLGMFLNVIVVSANGGYMPTYPELLEAAGRVEAARQLREAGAGIYANNMCINCEGTTARLSFLGDVLYVPAWIPLANVFSLGDVLLMVGLILFLQAKMRATGEG